MASILIVGTDAALLEGVAQTLVGAGHHVSAAKDIPEALETLHGKHPLIALVHCEELAARAQMMHSVLAHGGALLGFHCDDDDCVNLTFAIKRTILAILRLPLERQRLLALIRYIEIRAHAAGRELGEADDAVDLRRESSP